MYSRRSTRVPTHRLAVFALGAISTFTLGCSATNQPADPTPSASAGAVRLINLVESQAPATLCADGEAIATEIAYGDVTAHVEVQRGDLAVTLEGDCGRTSAASPLLVGGPGALFTAVVAGESADEELFVIGDDLSAPAEGFAKSRAFHSDPEAGPISLARFFPDGRRIELFRDLEFGRTAAGSDGLDFDPSTGYAHLAPVDLESSDFGALRAGTDHRIVRVTGPVFDAGRVYSAYPAGSVVSGEPPATVLICDDTDAGVERRAECTLWPVEVVGDPEFGLAE